MTEYAAISNPVQWSSTAKPPQIHPEPESPKALTELSIAAAAYAKAAESFIAARYALNEAKDEWLRCQRLIEGLMDKEGI